MKMELDYDTVLEVALGGPEIGPLNMVALHGLLREVFQKSGLSQKELIIEEEDPIFGNAYNFIKSKVDQSKKRPRTAGGGYSRERSKVSVIVSDYARSTIGLQPQPPPAEEKPNSSSLLPADVEDRLRFIESQLKIVKNFPSVDELRMWSSEKTSPDTIVTDLWHFVSLNHRMNGAEEGIQKLTELVDKLIPELKKLNDGQNRCQGQIDDLYSQFKALSDRTSRIDERIDSAGEKAEKQLEDLLNDLKDLEDKFGEYPKLNDLQDFVLCDTFMEEKDKARLVADQINDQLATKAPLSMLNNLPDNGDIKHLMDEINKLREQMDEVPKKEDLSNLEMYVKWPQLEDAITISPGSSRPGSSGPMSGRSEERNTMGNRPISGRSETNRISGGSRPISGRSDSRVSFGSHHGSRPGSSSNNKSIQQSIYQPSDNVIKRLNDLGMLAERQNDLMNALEVTREQLALKADKTDLDGILTEQSMNDLLNVLRNMREEVNGLQAWRGVIDDEKVPAITNLLKELEQQVANLLNTMSTLNDEDKGKQKSIALLFTYVDRLEENKLDRDDVLLLELAKSLNKDELDSGMDESLNDKLKALHDALKDLKDQLSNHENLCKKDISDINTLIDDKLDRSELQPLREYLENRYNVLSQQSAEEETPQQHEHQQKQQQQQQRRKSSPKYPTPPNKSKTSVKQNGNSISVSHTVNHDVPSSVNMTQNGYVEQLGCSHPHYGETFVPHKKDAALFKTQMNFNCLSCDRPLTMQSNSHLQTIRGRPLNAYELDQLRLLQKILKGDKRGNATRPCGGKHTSAGPINKRISARVNTAHSLPVMENNFYDEDDLLDGEVDIEGLDGKLYKGLISQKDLKRHLRSKSANAQLRTVSPRSKTSKDRPISGKSVDFTSSYSSGLGTTHGSIDIQIDH